MLFGIERVRIEVFEGSDARDGIGQEFSEDVGNNAEEDDRHEDGLGLEVEDFLQDCRMVSTRPQSPGWSCFTHRSQRWKGQCLIAVSTRRVPGN